MTNKTDPGLNSAYALNGPDAARRLYGAWAETYDEDFAKRTGYRSARRVAEIFTRAGGRGPVLDVGCGTGLVADDLPAGMVVDGIDLSSEMLAQARAKGRYRALIEADLGKPLPELEPYSGLVSAGVFTHGHLAPKALVPLLGCVAPGGIVVITSRPDFLQKSGFNRLLDGLVSKGTISRPFVLQERVYDGPEPPEGHAEDMGLFLSFRLK